MNTTITRLLAGVCALSLAACSSAQTTGTSATPATAGLTSSATPAAGESPDAPAAVATPITITIAGTVITATLNDSQAAQDLVAALPITVPSVRNNDIEYFGAINPPLTETGPFYDDVEPGHIVYYAPKDEVALIFEPTGSPGQLTKIGDIASELDIFDGLADNADILYQLGQ